VPRLGNIPYWLCSSIAVIALVAGVVIGFIALGAFGVSTNPGDQVFIATCLLIFGCSTWIIGRAFHYTLGN